MKKLKRFLASLMVVVMVLTAAPLSGFVGLELNLDWLSFDWLDFNTKSSAASYSGTCGENLTWTLNESTDELVISGSGDMYNYDWDAPWIDYGSSISTVTIEEGVTSIGYSAFVYCNVGNVTIPDSVTTIGKAAFYDCEKLTSITIPDIVTTIGDDAFRSCDNLMSVTIGKSVSTIGDGAFSYCYSLISITIPDIVTTIGDDAFKSCDNLISVTIGKSVSTIGDGAFSWCTSLTSITIPDSVTTIGDDAFYDCESLTSVTIGNSVTTIGAGAFRYCVLLTDVIIPNSVYNIGNYAFAGCTSFTSITLPDSITNIGHYAFYDCESLVSVTIGNSVITIGDGAFEACFSLTSATIGNSVTTIGAGAFRYCVLLTDVTISNSLTTISNFAFFGCASLTSIIIPDSVTTIGWSAFNSCDSLTSVTIGESVTTIGKTAFSQCYSLTSMKVDANNKFYSNDSFGVLYNKDKTTLIQYPIGNERTSFTIPDSVTTIGYGAFIYCTSLTSITIPDSVTAIGESAFSDCYSLTDVYYGGSYEGWQDIFISSDNDPLKNATIHYAIVADVINANLDYYIEEDDSHKKLSMSVTFDERWFTQDSIVYNHDLGRFCSQFTVLGYTKASHPLTEEQTKNGTRPAGYITKNQVLKIALSKMGFSDMKVDLSTPREEVNYFIANKKINVNSEEFTLIYMGFIGSYMEQWYSNFDPGTGKTHAGFKGAANSMLLNLYEYIKDKNLDKSKTKIVITGHSRGAAVSNLVAAELIQNELVALKENIYTYAFATPNSTALPERKNVIYKRIFNIVNPEDFVTKVLPTAWEYGKYGETYILPSRTNTSPEKYNEYLSNMRAYFSSLTNGKEYYPFPNGEDDTLKIVQSFTKSVGSIDDFYNDEKMFISTKITPWDFFQITICPLVGSKVGSSEFISAISFFFLALGTVTTSSVYRDFCEYFLYSAVLDRMNQMAPAVLKIILPLAFGAFGASIDAMMMNSKPYFENSHQAETYCAYMMTMTSEQMANYPRILCYHEVNSSVDVEVIDKATGEVVGRIVNNVVDEEIAAKNNAIIITVDSDSKGFWLPSDGDYEIRLIGNGNGPMDYTVSTIDPDVGETKRVNFFEEIEEGKEITGEVNSEDFALEEYTLSVKNEAEKDLLPSEVMTKEDIINYSIDVNVEGYGNATQSMIVSSGDYVSLVATPVEGNEFLGWYEDGTLISTNMQYGFVAKKDRTFVAKFSMNKEPDTSDMCGDSIYWSFNEETGELLVFGTGEMTDYDSANPVPWDKYKSQIQSVYIADGVTDIGSYAFSNCTELASVTLPTSLTTVNMNAFDGCLSIQTVIYLGTKSQWTTVLISDSNEPLISATLDYPNEVHECTFGEWVVTVEPDAVTAGEKAHTCIECGETETVTISATGFEATEGVAIDFVTGIFSGISAGETSLDAYTTIVNENYVWEYEAENGKLGTGSKAILKDGDTVIGEYTILVYGDTTGDSWYDGQDAIIVDCLVNGMLTKEDVGEAVYTAADCNHDGVIDQLDVDLLNQAGTLLANVDQSKPAEVLLETSSAYVEYLDLIDQSPEIEIEYDTDTPEADVETEDAIPGLDAKVDIFGMIMNFIRYIIEMILSRIPVPYR